MTMWAQDRQQRILLLLSTHRQLSTEHLARELQISRETLRRDLVGLEDSGKLSRVHGGVTLAGPREELPPVMPRVPQQADVKRIAVAAADLIRPGESCFIDAGPIASALARLLTPVADVSVVTNSTEVAGILRGSRSGSSVLLLGGAVTEEIPGTFGELTIQMISQFSADVAVISPSSVQAQNGAMYQHLSEASVARAMAARAGRVIVLADHARIGQTSRAVAVKCEDIGVLVTDPGGNEAVMQGLDEAGVKRIVVA